MAAACLALAVALPNSASARWSGWAPYENHYLSVWIHCWHAFRGECGRNLVDDQLASGKPPSKARVEASSERMTAWLNPPAPVPTTTYVSSDPSSSSYVPTTTTSGDWSNVPGVPASFAACVAMAESTNGINPAAGGNVYGIIDPVPGTDPVADPQGAMAALYAQSGPGAWAPYDGC